MRSDSGKNRSVILAVIVPLVLLIFKTAIYSAGFDQLCMDQLPGQCWRTEDVIDQRIEWHAQAALMAMFEHGGEEAASASAILCAVKRGQIEGIYRHTMKVPALRAREAGTYSWKIIPPHENSICYDQPAARTPIIVIRDGVAKNRPALIGALQNAWKSCRVIPTMPRCYIATIPKRTCNADKYNEVYFPCMRPYPPKLSKCLNNISKDLKACKKQETQNRGAGEVFDYCVQKFNLNYRLNDCYNKYQDKEKHKKCKIKADDVSACDSAGSDW
ncbi:hypothetical protein [Desulforhopalus singaporensis]|uniref:Uncharacterized protein n=1 Tax=Desulforhopalus singaporensis TaxID=91360 RepID=A0A1H0UR34_9BACT|nr:hypothetical protein [Desulforhopalus singaporensis]SDP68672.1 hypothetical protein SAMN05660330_03682 [Desulforhopalus singaporensis]